MFQKVKEVIILLIELTEIMGIVMSNSLASCLGCYLLYLLLSSRKEKMCILTYVREVNKGIYLGAVRVK